MRYHRILPLLTAPVLAAALLPGVAHAAETLTVGAVQGTGVRSPLAPVSGNGTSTALYDVRGVITQKTLARTAAGASQYGFFLQSRLGTEDGDPATSDGVFVFMSGFTSLIGGYVPTVGDEVVIRARVSEYFNFTELSSASLVTKLASDVPASEWAVTDAAPPASLTEANAFWERHEGEQMRVRAGSAAVSGRDVFSSTADAEIYLLDRDDPLLDRADPYARRVFRDAHPLDDVPGRFDNGNGNRVMVGPMGLKAVAGDSSVLLPPATTFDTVTSDAVGGLYYAFQKYGIQVSSLAFAPGADPSKNSPPSPAHRWSEFAVSTYNVENLYDFRDDPFDGCDFLGNTGCPGVSPPFDYVPASEASYTHKLADLADQVVNKMHAPDLILAQEAEDQDICSVVDGKLSCGSTNNADGRPDTLQDLALTIQAAGGPAYDAAFDRSGADARGIVAAFLYRTDRVSLAVPAATDPVLGATPAIAYRGTPLPQNTEVSNPKTLNAVLPADVDRSTGVDGPNVFTRAPQVGLFTVRAAPGSAETFPVWAISNHYSSGPDSRVGQRREQAAYGAAITTAIQQAYPQARIAYGGDLNVFPRPDDPVPDNPGDQLGPLYNAGLRNLWDDLVADVPQSAYSYVFQGQAQTLDQLFVNEVLHEDLVQIRAAHINADWSAADDTNGSMGSSDHDPQIARFHSRAAVSVGDASVVEGDSGRRPMAFPVTLSRPVNRPVTVCASAVHGTALPVLDYDLFFGCAVIPAGGTTTEFLVQVRGDRRSEPDERFSLIVGTVSPGIRTTDGVATGTITDDD